MRESSSLTRESGKTTRTVSAMAEGLGDKTNFGFLRQRHPLLRQLGEQAERYFGEDPSTSLVKLRTFAEKLSQLWAARTRARVHPSAGLHDILHQLRREGSLSDQQFRAFDIIRSAGNKAAHEACGTHEEALLALKLAHALGSMYYTWAVDKTFVTTPFIPPPDPKKQALAVKDELESLRQQLQDEIQKREQAQNVALEEAKRRAEIEALALIEAEERVVAETREAEARQKISELEAAAQRQHEEAVATTLTVAEQSSPAQLEQSKAEVLKGSLQLDEATTRRLIDESLREAGWEADSRELTYHKGARPAKGRHLAIAEWPTKDADGKSGRADYVLFSGLTPLGVVEAKRAHIDVKGKLEQAKKYSRGFGLEPEMTATGPWGDYVVPFVFSTNGRPFQRQFLEKSGIWFQDLRREIHHARPLSAWRTPEGLRELLSRDPVAAHLSLSQEAMRYLNLWPHQEAAIAAVEQALEKDQRDILLAMATGTGKTRTALALIYRLLKAKRFHRVLFLVDRTALGEQAHNAFVNTKMESLSTFAEIYQVKALGDLTPEPTTRVHIATVQAMVRRLFGHEEGQAPPATDAYDLVIVDECHRGYSLDRDMSEVELEYRSEEDYISKYRRVLDHFDAVRIGLTATPALHTTDIFGEPVHRFGYREAVVAGVLVDHEPPFRIVTALAEDGMTWKVGEPMEYYHAETSSIDLVHAPDEVTIEIDSFNKRVVTENFNRAICQELVKYPQFFPSEPGKTLIFCARDDHADKVVRLMKEALAEEFGEIRDDHVAKITGAAHDPAQLLRKYKNERLPKIAVTVDLLTTGVDVPEIVNLVFLRRVKSRILYEQMMGRATRKTDTIDKLCFFIFDAVGLYEAMRGFTDMKPVVTPQSFSFVCLAEEVTVISDPAAKQEFLNQFIAKLQRKRLGDEDAAVFSQLTGGADVKEVLGLLRSSTPEQAANWLREHPGLSRFLDEARSGAGQRVLISAHADEVRRVERGYGPANRKPADYLDEFTAFIANNLNEIPALKVVTQRPRDLTRAELKELRTTLANVGFTAPYLQTAWEETTSVSVAAGIIGFIRQRALGSPLVAYDERVDRALKNLLSVRAWSPSQRKWLERIGKQIKLETVVDVASLDEGRFRDDGGFRTINKAFDGAAAQVLGDLQEAIWNDEIA